METRIVEQQTTVVILVKRSADENPSLESIEGSKVWIRPIGPKMTGGVEGQG